MNLDLFQSENEDLQKGDVIKKIDEYDVRDLRHVDAQNLLQNSESVRLVIERSEQPREPSSCKTSQSSILESIIDDRAAIINLSEDKIPFHLIRN